MEIKKSPKVDLERKRSFGLLIGFAVSSLLLLAAFQWSIPKTVLIPKKTTALTEEDNMPITVQQQEALPVGEKTQKLPLPLPSTDNYAKVEAAVDNSYVEETQTVVISSHYSVQFVQPEEPQREASIQMTEQLPEFPGGQAALLTFLRRNVNYPISAQESGIQGRVIVQFVVNKDGTVSDPVVLRSVSSVLDREAVRVIMSMPRWRPGMQGGRPVRATYALPVSFKLKYN